MLDLGDWLEALFEWMNTGITIGRGPDEKIIEAAKREQAARAPQTVAENDEDVKQEGG